MTKKCLLVFTPEFYGLEGIEYWGGMGQVAANVASRLNSDYKTFVFTRTGHEYVVEHTPQKNLHVFLLPDAVRRG